MVLSGITMKEKLEEAAEVNWFDEELQVTRAYFTPSEVNACYLGKHQHQIGSLGSRCWEHRYLEGRHTFCPVNLVNTILLIIY